MLDKEGIKRKISAKTETIENCYGRLHKERNITLKELEHKHDLQTILERNFQIAIEACMDIGEILISYFGYEKPPENKDIFLILGKHNILPEKFAKKFAPAGGFRNVLVHHYDEVDIHKLYEHLQEIDDFDKFAKYIAKVVRKMK